VNAFRQAIAETENVEETDFEDDGDYVFLHYEVIMEVDYDVQDAIALVEATIHKVEERTELLLGRRTDGLLGIYDRHSFDADLNYVLHTSIGTVSVVMADIDHFKNVNDTHGHQVGDDVLRAVARVLVSRCGVGAAAYRYGGEELIAILSNIDHDEAMKFAESVRLDVEKLRFENPALSVTLSLGAATFPIDGATFKELVGSADAALYDAKHSGRNCVKGSQHKAADAAGEGVLIRVHVMLNKMKSGRLQTTVIQPGTSTGAVMTYRDEAEVRNLLKSFTLTDGAIEANLATLSEIGPMELLKVVTIDISQDLLQSLGFKGV
jgi:diguanylate cyclase (GGDEF)-like protein